MGLGHVIFDGKTLGSPQMLFTYDGINYFVSSTGEKIVYQVVTNFGEPSYETKIVDGKWTESSSVVMDDGIFYIEGLSGDGKSLLLKNGAKELMLSSYEDNQWSKPIDLGYQMTNSDNIRISEDGNTIAVAGARKPLPSSQSDAIPVFDLYSLVKDASGKWQQTRLNDEESAVLTPSGNKIFWVKQPISDITGISQPGMY